MKVLVIDDNRDVLYAVGAMFKKLKFKVELSTNGFQALRALKKEKFDLLITDFDLPVMNGLNLINEAKKLYPKVDVVLMSGDSKKFDYAENKKNINYFLSKPFGVSEIIKIVEV